MTAPETKMHPPLVFCALFRIVRDCGHLRSRLFLLPTVHGSGGKNAKMRLKIRYENEYQTVVLDAEATEELWVSLSLEGEGLTQEEKEKLIQDTWEERFNRPDYNNWHKFDRHRGRSKAQPGKDDAEDEVDTNEPLMEEVADDRIFRRDELDREERESYETICDWVYKVLVKKPEWADAFIAVRLDGESIREYAARIGADENNITQKLKRAEKKLRENYIDRQI